MTSPALTSVPAASLPMPAELERLIAADRFRDGMSLAALMMSRHRLRRLASGTALMT